jgi:hypothetical protein
MTRVRDTQPKAGDAKQGSAREWPDGEAGTPKHSRPNPLRTTSHDTGYQG